MKKKIRLNLGDLKINSFVTSVEDPEALLIKGGSGPSCDTACHTNEFQTCQITRDRACVPTYPPHCGLLSVDTNCFPTSIWAGC